ncbi:hypothetical protein NDU88_001612 [Pleurodeles waltl]|uniref:Uncharacterized protein n=1 Tax=Pleurodeles waltl TaxID=8319 RepID=A0AAV7NCZ2_PLEWA|nr:hypothetical protein NDU88_001612 [Pleurodeles waltl]
MAGPAPRMSAAQNESGAPQDLSVSAIIADHTQKFDNILNAVQSIKSTLEPKIDALFIDVGQLREEHKKLKDRVVTTEVAVSGLRPPPTNATQHIKELQKERGPRGGTPGGIRRTRAAPTAKQASMEREQEHTEVELRVDSPASSVRSEERHDKDSPELDVE